MQKSVVSAGPGNLVGRKQNKQFNKENKDWPMAFSKAWVHWDFSGCPRKGCIKEDPCKANRPRKEDSLPLHTAGGRDCTLPFLPIQGKPLLLPTNRSSKQWPTQSCLCLDWKMERWRTQPKFIMTQWTFASDHRSKSQEWPCEGASWVRSLQPAAYLSWMRIHFWNAQGLSERVWNPQLCHFCSGECHEPRPRADSWSSSSLL